MAARVFPCFLSKKVGSNKEKIGVIKDTSRRVYFRLKMIRENHRRQRHAGYLVGAFVPFPRSTWIHPHVPHDDFDRVCKVIWARAKECEERFGRGHSAADSKRRHGAGEQQKDTNDSSENTQCEEEKQQLYRTEFTLPCPYLSGRRHPCVAKSARAPSPVMEEKMKLNKEETEREGDLDKGEQQHLRHDSRSQSINHCDPSSETSERVDEQMSNSFDGCASDGDSGDDGVILPAVRRCATDSGEAENSHASSERERDSQSLLAKKDFPPTSAARRGLPPYPTKPPASGKMRGQWEIPLSFHPRNIPTDTLASGPAAPVPAPVQGSAEAPRASSKTIAPLAAQTQRGPYDLLADFPALQPPVRPLALDELHGGNHKPRDAVGKREIIQQPTDRQESEASYESRMRNVPHEVSSICVRDQKSKLNPQTFGSQSISCKVAGTDGAGVNARSWACAAKAGMKRAAAPQERARPCSFQQIVTINRAKGSGSQSSGGPFISWPPVLQPKPVRQTWLPAPAQPVSDLEPGSPDEPTVPLGSPSPRFPLHQARGSFSEHQHA